MSTSSTLIPLSSQVGGHAGVSLTEDGSLLIKPTLAREVKFYESLSSDPSFEALRPFVPMFFGTLRLHGVVGNENVEELAFKVLQEGAKDEDKDELSDSVVLENLLQHFLKPNILDIKLGTVLYDDDASDKKKARMEITARDTTSFETGVRLTGFQVHDNVTGEPVKTDKSYGKTIKAVDLPDGFVKFFPLADEECTLGLPKDLLLPILESMRTNITEIREALSSIEMRMVAASLLLVYEGDWERVKEGLSFLAERGGSSGEVMEEDEDDEDDDDDDDDDDGEAGTKKIGSPYTVKLIDFAHTKVTPGRGPDQGLLLGVDTTLRLLEGRIAQVRDVT